MIPVNRTTVLQGPAIVIFGGQTFYSKGDISVSPKETFTPIDTLMLGKNTDQRLKDVIFNVSFVPSGEVTAALLALLVPYASYLPGNSVFGATDSPLTIITQDATNNQFTFSSGALTKMPELSLKADATPFGAVEFTCIGAKGAAYNASNRLVTIATKKTTGAITGTSNANPDVITSAGHGLANGDLINISGSVGDTAINITGYVVVATTNTFEIATTPGGSGVAGNGAWTSGGVWELGALLNISNIITTPFVGRWASTIPSGNISSTSNATPDVITTDANHGLVIGDEIVIAGVTGDTAVNGTFYVKTVPLATTLTISATPGGTQINGNGDYISGGTWTRSNPLDQFDTEAGFQVSFDLALKNKESDGSGLYDIQFSSLTVKAKGKPIGPTPSDMIAALGAQGSAVLRGASIQARGQNLYLSGNGLYVKISQAAVIDGKWEYSDDKNRIDDVQWVATRTYAGNAPNALIQVSTTTIS